MRILYLSCHEVLGYDEARLLRGLGHEVLVVGPCGGALRPAETALPGFLTPEEAAAAQNRGPEDMDKNLVARFDLVLIAGKHKWIRKNWRKIRNKKALFRLIGQAHRDSGAILTPYCRAGLKIIGYSPVENKTCFAPGQVFASIRFYKDEQEFNGYRGEEARVLTVCNDINRKKKACQPERYLEVTAGFPRLLCGFGNEALGDWARPLPYPELREAYRRNRVYFYLGTRPAAYTLSFIEAFMTGIPVVALAEGEMPLIIRNGVDGFVHTESKALRESLRRLLEDRELALRVGQAGRETARALFSKDRIRQEWQELFARF